MIGPPLNPIGFSYRFLPIVVGRGLWITPHHSHALPFGENRKSQAIYPSAAGLAASKRRQGSCLARTLGYASRPMALASHARSAPSGPGLSSLRKKSLEDEVRRQAAWDARRSRPAVMNGFSPSSSGNHAMAALSGFGGQFRELTCALIEIHICSNIYL